MNKNIESKKIVFYDIDKNEFLDGFIQIYRNKTGLRLISWLRKDWSLTWVIVRILKQ